MRRQAAESCQPVFDLDRVWLTLIGKKGLSFLVRLCCAACVIGGLTSVIPQVRGIAKPLLSPIVSNHTEPNKAAQRTPPQQEN